MQKIINGKLLAEGLLDKLKTEISDLKNIRKPALAVILVGDNPASLVYVRNKKKACNQVGIQSIEYNLPANTKEEDLINLIKELNANSKIDGILVQLPLPKELNSHRVLDCILPHKDVDGFHPTNMGYLALNSPKISPCTPHGVMYLLDSLKLNYHGKHAVILGSSNIVGRPMGLELLNRGATISICNSKTSNLEALVKQADILIAAIGKPKFIQGSWLKVGVVVIDVGINRLKDGSLSGDVDFETAREVARFITPVPGGVGPMTIAMLLQNTMTCFLYNNF